MEEKSEYVEKSNLYRDNFSLGYLGKNVNDKLVLVSLVSLVYIKTKAKNKNVKPIDILLKIRGKNKIPHLSMLESLSVLVEDFAYDCTEADKCGMKSSDEVVKKIKELLSVWVPF